MVLHSVDEGKGQSSGDHKESGGEESKGCDYRPVTSQQRP